MKHAFRVAAAAVALATAAPALAQKSADTLRLGINDPFIVLSGYHVPVDEAGNFYRSVYEMLVNYDERGKKWVPSLAKSFTRVNPTTLEFELRDNVTFHNGNKFDADDVVTTIDYIRDPKVPLTFKTRYTWVDKVEKLGPYKVRITSTEPLATDMQLIAYRFAIWDSETFQKYEDKQDYGRLSAAGTGVMKLVSMDRNKGVLVERVDNHHGDKQYFRAGVKRVHGIPLPDRQTQIAQLLTGGIDMIRNASPDDATELGKNPKFVVSNTPTATIYYIGLDAAGRSGNKPLSDVRVRKAIWMSVDRDAIIANIIPGGPKVAEKTDAICFKTTTPACNPSVAVPKYDPEGAKKLLAEAGYPNGIDYEYSVFAPNRAIGEAVAGSLLRAGIRASVRPVPITVYRKDQIDGKLQSWSIMFPTASHPDASNTLQTLLDGPAWQYFDDNELRGHLNAGIREFDEQKRAAIYQKAFDRINSQHYLFPLSSVPNAYVHTPDIVIRDNPLMAGDTTVADYFWK